MLVATLSLVGVGVAIYLTLYKMGAITALVCSIGSCETVQTSRWATFLHLPVATWGIGFYVVLFSVALAGTMPALEQSLGLSRLLVALAGWGVLFSAWLTYLELWVIRAICIWCVGSAVIVLLVFIASVLDWRERVRQTGEEPVPD
jgi:uncharacterized membrane protein